MFGSKRLMWLRIYSRMGNRITLLPHSCHFPRQATAPMKLVSWILICNNNEVWKEKNLLSSACWIQWRVSMETWKIRRNIKTFLYFLLKHLYLFLNWLICVCIIHIHTFLKKKSIKYGKAWGTLATSRQGEKESKREKRETKWEGKKNKEGSKQANNDYLWLWNLSRFKLLEAERELLGSTTVYLLQSLCFPYGCCFLSWATPDYQSHWCVDGNCCRRRRECDGQ